jgi:hypothetical protein
MMKNDLLKNIDRLHTTEMGAGRITRNLGLKDEDPMEWCRARITDQAAAAERRGKNWYVRADGCVITVNASSFTIITAHKS